MDTSSVLRRLSQQIYWIYECSLLLRNHSSRCSKLPFCICFMYLSAITRVNLLLFAKSSRLQFDVKYYISSEKWRRFEFDCEYLFGVKYIPINLKYEEFGKNKNWKTIGYWKFWGKSEFIQCKNLQLTSLILVRKILNTPNKIHYYIRYVKILVGK